MPITWKPSGSVISDVIWDQVHELGKSPAETWSDTEGVSAAVALRVPWDSRWDVLEEIVNLGLNYPHLSGGVLYARSASISPLSSKVESDGAGTSYEFANLNLQFQPADRDSATGTVYAESIEPSAEFIVQDYQSFQWGAGGAGTDLLPNEAPGKINHGFEYIQTRYGLSSLHIDLLTAPGTVNAAPHTASMLGLTFPAQTLLFNNPSTNRTIDSDGNGKWTLKTSLSYNAFGWNKFWRAESQAYEQLYLRGTSTAYNNFPTMSWGNILV